MDTVFSNYETISIDNHWNTSFLYTVHLGEFHSTKPHKNNCFSLIYIAHGFGFVNICGISENINEGDIILLPPDVIYNIVPGEDMRRIDTYCCFFDYFLIENVINSLDNTADIIKNLFNKQYIKSHDSDKKHIRNLLVRMIAETNSENIGSNIIISSLLNIVITMFYRNIIKAKDNTDVKKSSKVDEAINYIKIHIYNKISLRHLCEQLHTSPSFTCRLFKEKTGMTTSQYINKLRCDKIKDILANTNKPVSDIPLMFKCTPEYIQKIFKKNTGLTMLQYKSKYGSISISD